MKVSVIIPFRNLNPIVQESIENAKKQGYKDTEVIAVSDRIKPEIPGVTGVYCPDCKGVGAKRNAGVKVSKGDILLFLDADCMCLDNSIEQLLQVFKDTRADAVSGMPTAPKHGNLLGYITGLEYEDRFIRMGEGWVSIAATTCLGMKRDAFVKIGGFQDYTTGEATGEDWDFSAKFHKAGFKIFHTNKARFVHEHGGDTFWKYLVRRYHHARYRPTHAKVHKQTFEEYATPSFVISSTLLLCIPQTIRILMRNKDPRILLLPFLSIPRTITWLLGVFMGYLEVKKGKSGD